LFTFAAVLNLPVRVLRLYRLYKIRNVPFVRQITDLLTFTNMARTSTLDVTAENQLIFDHLSWNIKCVILWALLWNSLFQIINQVFRCVYYSYDMTARLPGKIWVNTFFPLAIFASVVAALIQAVAENRFREENSLKKEPTGCKKHMIEFWYNLWKVQTEGEMEVARRFSQRVPGQGINGRYINLAARVMDDEVYDVYIRKHEIVSVKSCHDESLFESKQQEITFHNPKQDMNLGNTELLGLSMDGFSISKERSAIVDLDVKLDKIGNIQTSVEIAKSKTPIITERSGPKSGGNISLHAAIKKKLSRGKRVTFY